MFESSSGDNVVANTPFTQSGDPSALSLRSKNGQIAQRSPKSFFCVIAPATLLRPRCLLTADFRSALAFAERLLCLPSAFPLPSLSDLCAICGMLKPLGRPLSDLAASSVRSLCVLSAFMAITERSLCLASAFLAIIEHHLSDHSHQ